MHLAHHELESVVVVVVVIVIIIIIIIIVIITIVTIHNIIAIIIIINAFQVSAGRGGTVFDEDPKRWRLIAEGFTTSGRALEIATAVFPQQFVLLAGVLVSV